jgi:putative membrane protein
MSIPAMIPQFNDHAANERTYLAWLRTGISIIAFGFVLERFSLFLHTVVDSLGVKHGAALSHGGREAGMAMVVAGLLALGIATWRFAVNAKRIARKETFEYSPATALALGGIVILLGAGILFLVWRLMAGM